MLRLHLCEYALTADTLAPVHDGGNRLRVARVSEARLLQDWQEAFLRELRMPEDLAKARSRTAHRIEDGEMWLLVDALDAPLAMAGHADVSRDEARIAPVYTPPELRRRGYARALVAQLCRALLARGKRAVYLAADRCDAGANALYQQIGFRAEGDQYHFEFVAAAA